MKEVFWWIFILAILCHVKFSLKPWFTLSRRRFFWPQYNGVPGSRMLNQVTQLLQAAFHLRQLDVVNSYFVDGPARLTLTRKNYCYLATYVCSGTVQVAPGSPTLQAGDLAYYFAEPVTEMVLVSPNTKIWCIEWQVPDVLVPTSAASLPWKKRRLRKYRWRPEITFVAAAK
jgi:hypothetical protein